MFRPPFMASRAALRRAVEPSHGTTTKMLLYVVVDRVLPATATYLSAQPTNTGLEKMKGVDIGVRYDFDICGLRASLDWNTTYLDSYVVTPFRAPILSSSTAISGAAMAAIRTGARTAASRYRPSADDESHAPISHNSAVCPIPLFPVTGRARRADHMVRSDRTGSG